MGTLQLVATVLKVGGTVAGRTTGALRPIACDVSNSAGSLSLCPYANATPMGKGRHVARQGAFRPVLNDAVNQANALPLAWPSGLERYPPAAHPTRCRHSAFQLSITLKICPTRMRAG